MQVQTQVAKNSTAITVADPRVATVAHNFGWKPNTVLARIKRALPSVVEQQLYLDLAGDFKIQPESFGKILSGFIGERELSIHDLGPKGIAREVIEHLLQTLNLIQLDRAEWGIRLSMDMASSLANNFGEYAAEMVGEVDSHIHEICEVMGWNKKNPSVRNRALRHILKQQDAGFTTRVDILEYFHNPWNEFL